MPLHGCPTSTEKSTSFVSTDGDPGIPKSGYLLDCLDSATPRALTLAKSLGWRSRSQKSAPWTAWPPGQCFNKWGRGGLETGRQPNDAREAPLDTQDRWMFW